MRSILDVFSRAWFINIILAACVVFVGAKGIGVWAERGGDEVQTVLPSPKTETWKEKHVTQGTMPPEDVYEVVAAKDLFRPERAEPVQEVREETKDAAEAKDDVVEEDLRIFGKQIVLYGVVMMDDYRAALINDPKPKSPKSPFLWVKEGENIGDSEVIVSAIKKESITLQKGAGQYEVPLFDQEKARGKAVAQDQRQSEKPVVVTTQPAAVTKSSAPAAKSAAAPQEKKESKVVTSPEGEKYRVIKTPFGNLKRRTDKNEE